MLTVEQAVLALTVAALGSEVRRANSPK